MLLPTAVQAVVHSAAFPFFAIIGYLAGLIVLVVFGIWGFRLASNGSHNSGGGHGGGPKSPEPGPAPPSGGRELADREDAGDFVAWEEQLGTPEREHAPDQRVSRP